MQVLVAMRYNQVPNELRPSNRPSAPDRGEERVLGGVEGVGLVAEHPPTQRVYPVVVRRDQELESVAVAAASRLENLPVAIAGPVEVVVDVPEANPVARAADRSTSRAAAVRRR